jgi:hypothetical protein
MRCFGTYIEFLNSVVSGLLFLIPNYDTGTIVIHNPSNKLKIDVYTVCRLNLHLGIGSRLMLLTLYHFIAL